MESDGTLILNVGTLSGGSRLTLDFTKKHGKPCQMIQLDCEPETGPVIQWAVEHSIRVLNIAGPRESKHPGLYDNALSYLRRLFQEG